METKKKPETKTKTKYDDSLQNFYNQKMKELVEQTLQQLELNDDNLAWSECMERLLQRTKIMAKYTMLINIRVSHKLNAYPDENEIKKLKCPFCNGFLTENGCVF